MNWFNLRKNKCPQCNKDFMIGITVIPYEGNQILWHKCGFKISDQKYKDIVINMNNNQLEKMNKESNL